MVRRVGIFLALLGGMALPAPAAEIENPLLSVEPFIGDWGMDPESEAARSNPELLDGVAFRLEWGDPGRRILRFYEGIPGGDLDRRILENLVTFNPRSGEIVALGYQLRQDYLYESTFSFEQGGFVRDYRVTYPPDQELGDPTDGTRGWIRYRDRCRLVAAGRLHCATEQMRDGEWRAWRGSSEGYTLLRRTGAGG